MILTEKGILLGRCVVEITNPVNKTAQEIIAFDLGLSEIVYRFWKIIFFNGY